MRLIIPGPLACRPRPSIMFVRDSSAAAEPPALSAIRRSMARGRSAGLIRSGLMAQRGHHGRADPCPLSGVKRTSHNLRARLGARERGTVYPSLMTAFICTACGTQYPPSEAPPDVCLICTDERQFVPASGQSWTTLERLRNAHSNKFRRFAAGLTTIETTPEFGIGQRAILARTRAGNVLWDCLALIDDATVDLLNGLGGYYTTMVEWSRALG